MPGLPVAAAATAAPALVDHPLMPPAVLPGTGASWQWVLHGSAIGGAREGRGREGDGEVLVGMLHTCMQWVL